MSFIGIGGYSGDGSTPAVEAKVNKVYVVPAIADSEARP